MISHIFRHEILRSLPASCMSFQRSKSIAKLPDSVPILKPTPNSSSTAALRVKTINKVMKAYLERSKQHQNFMKVKNDEFEIGRLHLANMMGLEAATMTQDDIDRAIEYLLPSGLFEKKARPVMKPPKLMFPKEKAAQFDNSGRPFSPFFYTIKPNYYMALHELAVKFQELDAFEDKMIAKGILQPPSEALLHIPTGTWINLDEMKEMFLEKIHEKEYDFFISTLERLKNHPYGFRYKDDIAKYRNDFMDMGIMESIPQPLKDADDRPYIEMKGQRKWARAKVIVRGNGTGKVGINDTDIFYFPNLHDREQIMYPLEFTEMLGLVDIEVDVSGSGTNAQSGAVRYGLALCLRSFVSTDMVQKMRIAGLLTEDTRFRGRKKYGQKGNRGKFTWKKR